MDCAHGTHLSPVRRGGSGRRCVLQKA